MARSQMHTNFPAGISSSRYASSELIGAYDEMRLGSDQPPQRPQSGYPEYHPHPGRPLSQPGPSRSTPSPNPPLIPGHQRNISYDGQPMQQPQQGPYPPLVRPSTLQPLITPTGSLTSSMKGPTHGRNSSHGTNPRTPTQRVRYNLPDERVYMPTSAVPPSNASTTTSRRRYDKLADVYSMSGDTADFARNFGDYVDDRCPRSVWFCAFISLLLMGLLFMMFGAFNIPFCHIQPMIPIFLVVSGLLIMTSCGVRMYGLLVSSPDMRSHRSGLSSALCCNLLEAILFIANVVWLILGAVWVYGSRRYVSFQRGMFEDHYCDEGLYWFAFAAVTLQITFIILAIVGLLILVCLGAFKEAEPSLASLED
ncbi:hypothetical protein PFISCL1PPCAC_5527 [Pristionchus fissidentatus]|uniref:Uncharacterized protein n=1 Tax=Pristionchus fissidentatus TaxID=1538716 RepID=A0AAV5V6R9_9BILA|nr:hypothetical protein PFISCL1PPCAC_5527 [Pristionchus fissidentatus]